MTHFTTWIGVGMIMTGQLAQGSPPTAEADVRMPFSELKRLLALDQPGSLAKEEKPAPRKPALLSTRLRLLMEDGRLVVDASFRAVGFHDTPASLPLVAGDIALENQEPEDALVVYEHDSLCLMVDQEGIHNIRMRLLPLAGPDGFVLALPPCPSAILETSGLGEGHSILLGRPDGGEETLTGGQTRAWPNSGGEITLRMLDARQTQDALRPPEPSEWTWQHQALVTPGEGELIYQIITSAAAAGGSGVEAVIPLPHDARDVEISGDDLVSQSIIGGAGRSRDLALVWKTRGILDRELMIRYRIPLRPLDTIWRLQTPGGEAVRSRFIIAATPLLQYAAEGLSGALTSDGLPAILGTQLGGNTCHLLETTGSAEIRVTRIPVAATAEGVVRQAEWTLRIEQDGAMLVTGSLAIEHTAPLGFVFDTPAGMQLLSCELGGKPVSPVDLGQGLLKVPLPGRDGGSLLSCTFTGRAEALDPVEGTLALSLPKVPFFIHASSWRIDLPPGYQAETHGNLTRTPSPGGAPPSRITLQKNLCRDERPEIRVFYQRGDLAR